jgi:phage shock protein A
MTHEELLRERVAKLEVQMEHLAAKLDDTHQKVEEMHAILLQAKGARWVIVGLAGIAGLASGLLAKAMPWSSAWPR